MNNEETQRQKNAHSNFLAIPEMQVLLENLKRKMSDEIVWVLGHSVYDSKIPDAEIRNRAAKAQSLKETIDYVQDYKSIIGPSK